VADARRPAAPTLGAEIEAIKGAVPTAAFPVSVKGVAVRAGRVLLRRNERDEWAAGGRPGPRRRTVESAHGGAVAGIAAGVGGITHGRGVAERCTATADADARVASTKCSTVNPSSGDAIRT
jgi:hypothetical protein